MSLTESKEIRQVFTIISTSAMSNSADNYLNLTGNISSDATESRRRSLMPAKGYAKGAVGRIDAAPGAGKSWTYTLRKNGADQAIVVTIADAATQGEDSTNKVAFAKGDYLSWKTTPAGTPSGMYGTIACIVVFEDDN